MTGRGGLRWRAVLAALAAGAALTCGEGGPGAAGVTVVDSAGVEIVENGGEGRLGALRLEPVLRLGTVTGEGPELFSEVYDVALSRSGRVLVGDNGSGTVRVFDASGAFLFEVGGRGGGPSEVTMVNDVFAVGDTVVLKDWQRGGKTLLFAPDGTFLEGRTSRRPDGSLVDVIHRGRRGWLAAVREPWSPPTLAAGEPWHQAVHLHRIDFDAEEPGPRVYSWTRLTLYGSSSGESGVDAPLFAPSRSYGFDREGRVYLTAPQGYEIEVRGPDGLVRLVRRAVEATPLDPARIEAAREAVLAVVDTLSRIPDAVRPRQRERLARSLAGRAALPVPEAVPPLGRILVSPDGSFWVERRDAIPTDTWLVSQTFGGFGGTPEEGRRWDLFDPAGRLLGSVELPARFRPDDVDGRRVVGVELDELDVEHVAVHEAVAREP